MEDPVRTIQEEHKMLLKAAELAEKIQTIKDDEVYHAKMHDLILFFRNYTELYHHPKEQFILYPALQGRSAAMGKDYLHELCDNHEDFKALVAEIENHYVMFDHRLLRITFQTYLDTLRDHILRENKIILSTASSLLNTEEKNAIAEKFREVDEKHGLKDDLIKEFYRLNLETV